MIEKEEELLLEMQKYKNIIIYGCGNVAKTVIRYLRQHNIQILGIASKGKTKEVLGLQNKPFSSYDNLEKDSTVILVACNLTKLAEATQEELTSSGLTIKYVSYELFVRISNEENIDLDFLCVGFVKSGTSSLHTALKKNKEIFMPTIKENYYLHWRNKYDNSPERLKDMYFKNAKPNQLLGNIEPSYHNKAVPVYECFGKKDCKIIFMMRHPANAAYSYFKMLMRRPLAHKYVKLYRGGFRYNAKMFDNYIQDYILSGKEKRFHYDKWIEEYLQYIDRDKVMFIFFEEAIKEPTRIMNEVQDFIGIKNKITYDAMPFSNDGKEVSKNVLCAYINWYLLKKRNNAKSKLTLEENKKLNQRIDKIHKYTMFECKEKILPEHKELLSDFYSESIHNLERITGKNLKGIWY